MLKSRHPEQDSNHEAKRKCQSKQAEFYDRKFDTDNKSKNNMEPVSKNNMEPVFLKNTLRSHGGQHCIEET